ncbi:MAG: hypothetical protein CYG61_01885 [Actinobacteria bacterium]|nr:MAG: hypothetical protein CYG61_01885 [Actinomycetota bacterium]
MVAIVLSIASVVWACSPQCTIELIGPNSGPAGTEVTITGARFIGPVEIRWDSDTGPLLGEAPNYGDRGFTVRVTIPQAQPRTYSIVAVTKNKDLSGRKWKASQAFEVTGAEPDPSTSGSPSGSAGGDRTATAPTSGGEPAAANGSASTERTDSAQPVAGGSPAAGRPVPADNAAAPSPAPARRSASGTAAAAAERSTPAERPASNEEPRADAVAVTPEPAVPVTSAPAPSALASIGVPTAWTDSGAPSRAGASLTAPAPRAASSGSTMALGLGLLALGAALATVATVMALSRRRLSVSAIPD